MSQNHKTLLTRLTIVPLLVITLVSSNCTNPTSTPTAQTSTFTPTTTMPANAQTGGILPTPSGNPAEGEKVFNSQGCISCHMVMGGGGQIGPKLDGVYGSKVKLNKGQEVTVDEGYIRESIINPGAKIVAGYQPLMPTTFSSLPAQELQNLIAFIASLK